MRRGVSGRTHCGRWTSAVPEEVWATRLVCTRRARHGGRHYSRWCGYEWRDGETPRKRLAGDPDRALP